MTCIFGRKNLYRRFLPVLIGMLLGIHTALAQELGQFYLMPERHEAPGTYGPNLNCLFHDETLVMRGLYNDGFYGEENCGYESKEVQLRDGGTIWTMYKVRAPSLRRPDKKQDFYIFESIDKHKCMISDHEFLAPTMMKFPGGGPVCGTTLEELVKDQRALWTIDLGELRSYKEDLCVNFGPEGSEWMAILSRWSDNPAYADFCGLPGMTELWSKNRATYSIRRIY